MRCRRARKWLSAYLDGELKKPRRSKLENHLEGCRNCAADLARFKQQWAALMKAAPVPPVPAALWSQVVAALNESSRLPWYERYRSQLFRVACVSGCVAVGLGSGALLSRYGTTSTAAEPTSTANETTWIAEAFDMRPLGFGRLMEGVLQCDRK